jgi:hypothetical protein
MPRSILAWEMCFPLEPGSTARATLREKVVQAPASMSMQAKWELYQELVFVAGPLIETASRGCWDFFDDDARAARDFDMWTQGMITREGVRSGPLPSDPYRGERRFMTFTMAFLLVTGSATEQRVKAACAIPEADLWKRSSFAQVLSAIAQVNFAAVLGDVAYVLPGKDDEWALTAEDLQHPKFHYLRELG